MVRRCFYQYLVLWGYLSVCSAVTLLDLIPFNFGQKRYDPSLGDYASQGVGFINYLANVRPSVVAKTNQFQQTNLLGLADTKGIPDLPGLPNIPLLSGVPAVPGLAGSIPGAGGCLPKGTPLVNVASPSILQDLLRGIPGAQDLFKSLTKPAKIDPKSLMGKWYWVISTPSVLSRYCATSELNNVCKNLSVKPDLYLTARPRSRQHGKATVTAAVTNRMSVHVTCNQSYLTSVFV
uniref:Lipocalin domain-containing protein n=1 Tax=Romanomermis culicivorax TaxID=13658 RepID=A0A915IXD2_ROMCU